MMNFFVEHYDEGTRDWVRKGITYDKALDLILGVYRDNDMTQDMLLIPNRIKLMGYSYIVVQGEDGEEVKDELCNLLPEGIAYDDDGARIQDESSADVIEKIYKHLDDLKELNRDFERTFGLNCSEEV